MISREQSSKKVWWVGNCGLLMTAIALILVSSLPSCKNASEAVQPETKAYVQKYQKVALGIKSAVSRKPTQSTRQKSIYTPTTEIAGFYKTALEDLQQNPNSTYEFRYNNHLVVSTGQYDVPFCKVAEMYLSSHNLSSSSPLTDTITFQEFQKLFRSHATILTSKTGAGVVKSFDNNSIPTQDEALVAQVMLDSMVAVASIEDYQQFKSTAISELSTVGIDSSQANKALDAFLIMHEAIKVAQELSNDDPQEAPCRYNACVVMGSNAIGYFYRCEWVPMARFDECTPGDPRRFRVECGRRYGDPNVLEADCQELSSN